MPLVCVQIFMASRRHAGVDGLREHDLDPVPEHAQLIRGRPSVQDAYSQGKGSKGWRISVARGSPAWAGMLMV